MRVIPIIAVPLLLAVACHGAGSSGSSSDTTSTSSAVTRAPLTVPANTILADTSGVLAPKGDGSTSVDDRGQMHQHIPIWVPPGRAGIQPNLSLDYSSAGANGMLGVGWGLSGLSRITRCPGLRKNGAIAPPVLWNDSDSFCLDGEPLTPDTDRVYYYKFRFDGSRLRYTQASPTDPGSWEMRTKDGRIVTFGGTTDSRYTATPATMTWAVSRVQDRAGNFMTVTYADPTDGEDLQPSRIDYTGSAASPTTHRSVTFAYETVARPDIDQRMFAGHLFTFSNRLHSIEMHAPNSANLDPLRSFSFGYATSTTTGRSLLTHVAECDGPPPSTLPVTGSVPLCRQQAFSYAPGIAVGAIGAFDGTITDSNNAYISDIAQTGPQGVPPNVHLLDVDGDGRDDVLYEARDGTYHLRHSIGNVFGPAILTGIPVVTIGDLPPVQAGPSAPLVLDFNSDGHADVLVNQGETMPGYQPQARVYLANYANGTWTLGGPGEEFQLFSSTPIYAAVQTADLNGDARPDLVMLAGGKAYYAFNTDGTNSGLSAVGELPLQDNVNYAVALTNYFMDFNNDGVTDLMTRVWYDDACRNIPIGENNGVSICDCDKIGYGAFDIDPHLYWGGQPTQSTRVGLRYCKREVERDDFPSYPTYGHVFGDFNGDGNVDVIETFTPHDLDGEALPMQLKLLLGGGDQTFTLAAGGAFTIDNPNVSFQTLDADGDGRTDLVARGYNSQGALPYTVWSWKDLAWQHATLLNGEVESDDWSVFTTGDVDGDGQSDFVALDGNGYLALYTRHPGPRADLLQSTTGDFTPATTVTYQPYRIPAGEDRSDCTLPLVCVTRAGDRVSEIDVDNGLPGGTNTQYHTYAGARSDVLGWGFLGFKKHTITDSATGAVTTRTFDFTRNTDSQSPFYPFVGQPTEVDTTLVYQSGTTNVTRTTTTTNHYEVRFLEYKRQFMVNPTNTHTQTSDSDSSDTIDDRYITRTFDDYGNETRERVQMPALLEERNTSTTYLDDWSNWLLALPTDVRTSSSTNVTILGGTTQLRETAYTYDALGQLAVQIDNPGAANGSSYDPLPPQADGVQTLYTRYTRDANGLPRTVEQLDNLTSPTQRRVTQYDRDASEDMFIIQKTDPANLVTQAAYDPGLGVIAAQTDAANVLTTFQYDTFGRIRADHPASGGGRVVTYHAATSGNFGSIDDHRAGQYNTTSLLDSLRRTVQTITTGRADGKSVYAETSYDELGRTKTVSRPHFSGVTPAKTTTTYDKLGRVTKLQGADGSVQTTSYLGLTVTTTNPDGNVSAVTNDMLGRPVTSVQAVEPGPSGLSGHVTTTTLKYGPFDTLSSSTDTAGNMVSGTYDRLGRLLWRLSPDSGVTVRAYDVFGELSAETLGARRIPVVIGWMNVGGTETDIAYDADGRVLTRTTPDMTQTFTYDSVMPGKLSSAAITGGPTITYTYDTAGRVATKKWNGPRGAIGFAYTYDQYDRLSTTQYPPLSNGATSLKLLDTYSGGEVGGQLQTVTDITDSASPKTYWKLRSTDASEAFPVADLRNGIKQTFAEDPVHPGWIKTITATNGTGTNVQSLRYTRDGAGRVRVREDLVDPAHPVTETFDYDGLERLTSWNWNGAAGARGVSYIYDDLGNLTARNITTGPGASVSYGYAGLGPHQVASDSLGTAYEYDDQGNQLVAPGRSFTWNTFERPISVTTAAGTYTMTYDADLARFSRKTPAGQTRYSYGGLLDEYTDDAGTHAVMTVMAQGRPVMEFEKIVSPSGGISSTTNTLLVDALGSIDTIIKATGRDAIKYDPFGARVTAADPTVHVTAPPEHLRAGFTGHDHDDDVNLIDMIGRVYDPQTQRFLSVDPPAPDPVDSQAYNPYAYVRNNPLNATDPTGYLEIRGSSLGLSPNAGLMWDSADTYLGWGMVTVYTIPYGSLPGEVQGASAQEGAGAVVGQDASKIGAVESSDASKVEEGSSVALAKFDDDSTRPGSERARSASKTSKESVAAPDVLSASCFGQSCASVWSQMAMKHPMAFVPPSVRDFWGTVTTIGITGWIAGITMGTGVPVEQRVIEMEAEVTPLTMEEGYTLGVARAQQGETLVLGKYPEYQNFLGPNRITLDVDKMLYSKTYNAGFVRGYLDAGGKIDMVSPFTEFNLEGAYGAEVGQVLGPPMLP
jgi:RHS repeat-associated protein